MSTPVSPRFEALLEYLKSTRGFDFAGYKPASLVRRIDRRMQEISMHGYDEYQDYLEVHPEEFTQLFNAILINVTSFFRDPESWEYIRTEIIPVIARNRKDGEQIRCWSVGCASGEEAYTLAILMAECLGIEAYRNSVKIYGTDVDEEALSKARTASYSEKEVEGVPAELLAKYFERNGAHYTFKKDLRRSVIFGRHDLIQDATISRINLMACRNILMYLNGETQAKILNRLHFALQDKGYLFLGKAEMLLNHNALFSTVALKQRIFAKVPKANLRDRLYYMMQPENEEMVQSLSGQSQLREAAFESSPTPQLVVDKTGTLVLTNGVARRLFGICPRDQGRPFQDLEISYRPVELRSTIDQAFFQQSPIFIKDVEWPLPTGEKRTFDIQVAPLSHDGEGMAGVFITFLDMTSHMHLQHDLERTRQVLETALEEVQSINEELETTNEELQSTNEELETTNEELQSTNEELETINEELQSTNEELETINSELNLRTEDLNQVNSFMESILTSMRGGVVVVDQGLRIQVWNNRCEDMWGLRADETLNTNLLNLDIDLPVEQLKRPIRMILSGETKAHEITLPAVNRRGKHFQCKVSLLPLVATNKTITGTILVMEETDA